MALGFKTGGRKKGTPNKTSRQVRETLQLFFGEELESGMLQKAIRMLPCDKYVTAMLKLTPFLVARAGKINPAEEAAEEEQMAKPWIWTPVGDEEEVKRRRAADPEEAALAEHLYGKNKKEPPAEPEPGEAQPEKRLKNLFLPLATREESDRVSKEMDLVTYARIIQYNDKNWDRWKKEEEETKKNDPNHNYYGKEWPEIGG